MNTVRFSVKDFTFADSRRGTPTVQVEVDGDDLFSAIERAGRSTGPHPAVDVAPGLSPQSVIPPSMHWLGAPDPSEGGLALIYDCECGEWECGGVLARITVTDDEVVWSDFRGPRGGREYRVGLLRFDRQQYERALRQLSP